MVDNNQLNTSNPVSTSPVETPLMTATKQPVAGMSGGSTGSSSSFKPNQPKKIFGIDRRSFATVLGLTLFFVIAMAGVLISLRQFGGGLFSPEAPESRPAADIVNENTCTLSFEVAPELEEKDCTSGGFTDNFNAADGSALNGRYAKAGDGTATILNNRLRLRVARPSGTDFDPKIAVETNYVLTGDFDAQVDVKTLSAANNNQGIVGLAIISQDGQTISSIALENGNANNRIRSGSQVKGVATSSALPKFKLTKRGTTVSSYYDIGSGFVKMADLTGQSDKVTVQVYMRSDGLNTTRDLAAVAASLDNFAIVCPTTIVYSCNSACTSDTQCQGVDSNFVCSANKCRLSSNTASAECQPATVYQCNSSCTADEQCQDANIDFVCDSTSHACRLENNPSSDSCQPSTITYACNSECSSNTDCTGVNANYVCTDIDGTNRCRLGTNTSSDVCEAPGASPSPTPSPTPTPTPTPGVSPTPTPTSVAIGCNDSCVTNNDCSNSNHICYQDKCRLESNPDNASCNTPTTTTTVAETPEQPGQPALPEELPKTGPEDWGNWLKAGLAALGVGAVLLLLL